jgi:hypothetical protein
MYARPINRPKIINEKSKSTLKKRAINKKYRNEKIVEPTNSAKKFMNLIFLL